MAGLGARLRGRLRGRRGDPSDRFALAPSEAPRLAKETPGELAKLFFAHRGRTVHKKVHYLELYERHFSTFRGRALKMLEIGVNAGGSLDLWRQYFGSDATIFGIDIDPGCASHVDEPNQVRIGSQDDPHFLKSVIAEMGEPDIILDDGSHIGRHQKASFDILFPLLTDGGLYVIEDINTSYWDSHYEGGYRRRGTAIELVKQMIDDLHGWYHDRPQKTPARDWIKGLHIYDAMVVIEKGRTTRPGHIRVG